MPRYIDADALIRLVQIDALCNGGNFSKRDVIGNIKALPTADVVPKSEYDRLEKLFNDMTQEAKGYLNRLYGTGIDVLENNLKSAESEIERLKQICHSYALQYGTVRDQQKVIDEIKADTAREIFEEIEKVMYNRPSIPFLGQDIRLCIAELKKKYTEVENGR